jgi:hypothetical protein
VDVLRDHRRSDLRHDLVGHRVRCNVKTNVSRDHRSRVGDRHRMGCFCGVYLSWIVNRAIQNHGHRVDLSIDPPCYDVDDPSLGVSRGLRMNDLLGGQNWDVKMGGNLYRHTNVMDDRNDLKMGGNLLNRNCVRRDLKTDGNSDVNLCPHMSGLLDDLNLVVTTDVNLCLRMNDLLGDQNLGDDHHDVLGDHHTNVMGDQNDRNLDVMMDANRDHRRNDPLDDHLMDGNRGLHKNVMDDPSLGVNLLNRNCVRHDLKMGGNSDVNLCLRMNDLLAGHLMDGSHVNRNCDPHDLMMVVTMDVKNLHVMLMVYLSKSCDRMSHDHLRCGHLKMRHHDMNRMDEMNLDGKMKIHHDCRP